MRWLVLTDDHPPTTGGVATWTARVVDGLRSRGCEVTVYARLREGLPPDVHGVRVPAFGRRGHLGMGWQARDALRQTPPERILCTTWSVVPPGLSGAHVVLHGSDLTRPTHAPGRRRRVLGRSRVWAVSHWLRRRARQQLGVEATVLPAPVDIADEPAPPGERWLWMGRAVAGKGGERFLHWLDAAGASGDVLGSGPRLQAWAAAAQARGIDARFHGWRTGSDLLQRIRAGRLLALCPSPASEDHGAEGLGLVGLEALGQGVPVVGVPVGGVPEAVGPGLVVPEPDRPADVAMRIASWWTPERGREGWAWVRGHHGTHRTVTALLGGP